MRVGEVFSLYDGVIDADLGYCVCPDMVISLNSNAQAPAP